MTQSNLERVIKINGTFNHENSAIGFSQCTLHSLNLFHGESVLVRNPIQGHTTLLNVNVQDIGDNSACLSKDSHNNLQVQPNSTVTILSCPDIEHVEFLFIKTTEVHAISVLTSEYIQIGRIAIAPFADTVQSFRGDIFNDILRPYFQDRPSFALKGRPIHKGDIFIATSLNKRRVQFIVENMNMDYGIISTDTIIHCGGEPIQRQDSDGRHKEPVVEVSLVQFENLLDALGSMTASIRNLQVEQG